MEALLQILTAMHPEVDFETCENLVDGKILDSFDIITLVAEINEKLDVTIPAEEIVPENFNSYAALRKLVENCEDR